MTGNLKIHCLSPNLQARWKYNTCKIKYVTKMLCDMHTTSANTQIRVINLAKYGTKQYIPYKYFAHQRNSSGGGYYDRLSVCSSGICSNLMWKTTRLLLKKHYRMSHVWLLLRFVQTIQKFAVATKIIKL